MGGDQEPISTTGACFGTYNFSINIDRVLTAFLMVSHWSFLVIREDSEVDRSYTLFLLSQEQLA